MNPLVSISQNVAGIAIAVAALTIPVWMDGVQPRRYEGAFAQSDEALEMRNTSAVARLFGEFRIGVSDMLFIKTEAHLHGGVQYYHHLDLKEMQQSGEIAHAEGTEEVGTFIPPPEKDWRGFIGHLDREVNPWLHPDDSHHHTSGREVLPLYRLAVMANPHNVNAYRIGVYWLQSLRTWQGMEEALKFAEEGVRNNPGNFMLVKARAVCERRMGEDEKALASFQEALRMGADQRPPEGEESERWDEDRQEELESSLRYSAIMMERLGMFEEGLALIEKSADFVGRPLPMTTLRERLEKKARGEMDPDEGISADDGFVVRAPSDHDQDHDADEAGSGDEDSDNDIDNDAGDGH